MSTTTSHVPAGLRAVTPYLMVRDIDTAIDFYADAFGAVEVMRHDEGGVPVHAKARIADSVIELGRHGERTADDGGELPPVGVHLYVEDVDAVLARATAAGARTLYPIEDQPYGDREVSIVDPCGITWFVATHLHD